MTKLWLTGAFAIAFTSGILPLVGIAHADDMPAIGCGADAKIDNSTAADARKKMSAAGYTQITSLKKGCDNFWHGRAIKDGSPTGVLLAPDGRVQSEGRANNPRTSRRRNRLGMPRAVLAFRGCVRADRWRRRRGCRRARP